MASPTYTRLPCSIVQVWIAFPARLLQIPCQRIPEILSQTDMLDTLCRFTASNRS
jgi:hypothetical protein